MEEFYIGQIFEGEYPPEAASWCNDNDCAIIQKNDELFEIIETPTIIETSSNELVSPAELVKIKNQVEQNKKDNETILDMLTELTTSVNMLAKKLA